MEEANIEWLSLLSKVASSPMRSSPRGQPIREILANQTRIDMRRPVVTVKKRKLGRRFLVAEAWWILSGRNDVRAIAPYSKEIASFSNDGIRFDGSYGPKIVDQLRYVVDSLERDADTRQAVLNIWRENPRDSKDVPCTLSVQWFIRNNKLHCIDTMRSSDVWLGIPYDCFNFSMLSAYVLLSLRQRRSDFDKVDLGSLTITAGSQHLYDRNLERVGEVFADSEWENYEPLDLNEFAHPLELLDFLEVAKDRRTTKAWLTELL